MLISYGDKTIEIESKNEEEEIQTQQITAAQFIIINIQNEKVEFENPTYQEIVNYYIEELNKGKIPSHNDFTNHEKKSISQFSIDVFSIQHELSSNWEKHGVFPQTEEELIQKGIIDVVDKFKLNKIQKLIREITDQLKSEKDEEQYFDLLKQSKKLKDIEMQLNAKLGRVYN